MTRPYAWRLPKTAARIEVVHRSHLAAAQSPIPLQARRGTNPAAECRPTHRISHRGTTRWPSWAPSLRCARNGHSYVAVRTLCAPLSAASTSPSVRARPRGV